MGSVQLVAEMPHKKDSVSFLLPSQKTQIESLRRRGWFDPTTAKDQNGFESFLSINFIGSILVVPNQTPPLPRSWGITTPPSAQDCCGQNRPALVYLSNITLIRDISWEGVRKTRPLGLVRTLKETYSFGMTLSAVACLIQFLEYGALLACPGTRQGKRIPVLTRRKKIIEGNEIEVIEIVHHIEERDKDPSLIMPAVTDISLITYI